MTPLLATTSIQSKIFTIRDVQVMIDKDLAEMYRVETKVLNQAVKRNYERFPLQFRFQLSSAEKTELVTNCDRFKSLKHSSSNPFAFTEQGVAMLSAVLRSDVAVNVSIQIIDAFVHLRKLVGQNTLHQLRINAIENKLIEHDHKFDSLFLALEKNELPQKGVFYNGQVFDAWKFISDLIRSAQKSLVLIDNYVDDSVLSLFAKRNSSVSVTVLTKEITKSLEQDVKKFNAQYPPVTIKVFKDSHDRFLIIDEKQLYHLGASLKDLGKKWFAFSKMEIGALEMLENLKKVKLP